MNATRRRLGLLAAAALLACSTGGPGSSGEALQPASGNGQAGEAGEPLVAPLVVRVVRGGASVAGITIAWEVTAGGGSISTPSSATDAQGLAAVSWTLGTVSGAAQAVTATIAGSASAPVTFTASALPGAPARLAFRGQPTDAMSGAAIAPAVQVGLEDRLGNLVADATSVVTVAIETNPAGGTLSGAAQVSTTGGLATFGDLNIDRMGHGYTLSASAPGLPVAVSVPFDVTVHLAFAAQPTETFAGAIVAPPVKVRATEAGIPLAGAVVSLGLEGSGVGALTGGAAVSTGQDGTAEFAELSVDDRGSGYRLVATGVPPSGPTGVGRSAPFDVIEVDQQQLLMDQTVGALAVGGASEQRLAQVVTAADAGDLLGLRVPVGCRSGALSVSIHGVRGEEPNDVLLASGSFSASQVRASHDALESYPLLRVEPPAPLAAGQKFAIVLDATGDCGLWQGPAGDSYELGDAYFEALPNPPGWLLLSGPAYDLPFQTIMR